MRRIICEAGETAFCSDRDYPSLSARGWKVDRDGYAWSSVNGKRVRMHQLVMGRRVGFEIDHKNEVKLDNRRENLQYLTPADHRRKTREMKTRGLDQKTRWSGRDS